MYEKRRACQATRDEDPTRLTISLDLEFTELTAFGILSLHSERFDLARNPRWVCDLGKARRVSCPGPQT